MPEYSPCGLLERMKVRELCTTDDPLDSLEWHKKINTSFKVLPSFRPDFVLNAENPAFADYISRLQETDGTRFKSIDDMFAALERRIDYFKEQGSPFPG